MRHAHSVLAAAALLLGCTRPLQPAAQGKHAHVESCHYDVTLLSMAPAELAVTAECSGASLSHFEAPEPASLPHLSSVRDGADRPLRHDGSHWVLDGTPSHVKISYRVDLDAIAEDAHSFDVALRIGDSIIAPASTWLLVPEPHSSETRVTVRVTTPPGERFVTGLERVGDVYRLRALEIPVATYALFGKLTLEPERVPGPFALAPDQHSAGKEALIDLAIADGKLDASPDLVARWVRDSAEAVGAFWHGFPVRHVLVSVLPVAGRSGVLFGKVLPESSPGIVILLGEHTEKADLYDDWVLVHELFHLGVPSFSGEGKWLDEGLATYYEPLIRARAGFKSEQDVWAEFVRAMPQGLDAVTKTGLENARGYRDIYWGGALMSLLADLEVREKSGGKRGLEDGLRAVLAAGGNASEVWPLSQVIEVSDRGTGLTPLADLSQGRLHAGRPLDLKKLWRDLGVVRVRGGVRLKNDAPLADARKAVVFGATRAPMARR